MAHKVRKKKKRKRGLKERRVKKQVISTVELASVFILVKRLNLGTMKL